MGKDNQGSVTKLPNGKFRVTLSLGVSDTGKRTRLSKVFDTKKEANAWRIQKLSDIMEYGNDAVKEVNGLFVPEFHKWLLNEKRHDVQSPQFRLFMRYYSNYIKPAFLKRKQKDITQEHFIKFFKMLDGQGVGIETQRKLKGLLHQYFETVYANTPMRNPLDAIKLRPPVKAPVDLKAVIDGEYKAVPKNVRAKFFEALDNEKHSKLFKPLCYIMYFVGCRISEALALKWQDIDFENRFLLVHRATGLEYDFDDEGNQIGLAKTVEKGPKTESGIRPLPLLDILCEVLWEWRELRRKQEAYSGVSLTRADDYIFAKNDGGLRTENGTTTMFYRFLRRHGLEGQGIHFHALRQTFSNSLFAKATDEKIITDLMGHTDISTTKKHYETVGKFESVKKAAEQLNAIFQPNNPKFKTEKAAAFAPEGYATEIESTVKARQTSNEDSQGDNESLMRLFKKLASLPEFQEWIEKAKDEPEM